MNVSDEIKRIESDLRDIKIRLSNTRQNESDHDNYIGLVDTPASYVGQAGEVPVVNAAEDALEFKPVGILDDYLLEVDQAAGLAVNDFTKATANGLVGRSYAETLDDLSGEATGAFDWNAQNLTNIGTLQASGITDISTEVTNIASGTTVQRPGAPAIGDIRYNSTTGKYEFYDGAWEDVLLSGIIGIADDNLLEVDMGAGLTAGDILRATAAGVESRTDAEILAQLSANADATFDWNDQRLENVLSLEVKNLSVDTDDDYLGLENHHKKTAGASDADDDFYAHDNYVALDQVGGTIGYLSGFYTEAWLINGTIAHDLEAIYNKVVISGGICSGDVIGSTDYIDMNGGSIDDLFGHKIDLDVEVGHEITGDVYGHHIKANINTDPIGDVYMVYLDEGANVDYGFYQDGSALNVLGGALQLATVEDAAADVDKFLVLDAGNVLDYRTAAELLADLSGDADAAFDWNDQNLTSVGTIALDGGQIAFPAAQSASADVNTLDDYEEGTWTPAIKFGGASDGVTYHANNSGEYTKIGNIVFLSGLLYLTNKGSSNGAATITGLPFTSNVYASVTMSPYLVSFADFPHMAINSGTAIINLYETTNAGVRTTLTDVNFSNNTAIYFNCGYVVA